MTYDCELMAARWHHGQEKSIAPEWLESDPLSIYWIQSHQIETWSFLGEARGKPKSSDVASPDVHRLGAPRHRNSSNTCVKIILPRPSKIGVGRAGGRAKIRFLARNNVIRINKNLFAKSKARM